MQVRNPVNTLLFDTRLLLFFDHLSETGVRSKRKAGTQRGEK